MHAFQLSLLQPDEQGASHWAHAGLECEQCDGGRMYMVHPSDPCACNEAICRCLAEGYARCDSCRGLRQIWPREMVAAWRPAAR